MMYTIEGAECGLRAICHRGRRADGADENTLQAFIDAKNKGYKYVECDVQKTSDNVLVISHNEVVGGVRISTSVYSAVKSAYPKILKFDEFCRWCKANGIHPYIDIKIGDMRREMASIVADADLSVTWLNLAMEQYSPNQRYCLMQEHFDPSEDYSKYHGNKFLNVNGEQFWTMSEIENAISQGAEVEMYTVNDISLAKLKAMHGVTGVTTDIILPSEVRFAFDIDGNMISV